MKSSLNPHVCIAPTPHGYTVSLHNCMRGWRGTRKSKRHPSHSLPVTSPQFWLTLPRRGSTQGTPGESQWAGEALEPLPALLVLYATLDLSLSPRSYSQLGDTSYLVIERSLTLQAAEGGAQASQGVNRIVKAGGEILQRKWSLQGGHMWEV